MRSGQAGTLSIVSTPIGNMEDITLRALRTLRDADLILAEDTRRTRRLCARHEIKTRLQSFHAHSNKTAARRWIERLRNGAHLALVADAGSPLISDPGANLVRAATESGIAVQSVPGPSAVTAALAVAAIPFESFRFLGFLPRSGARRKTILQAIADECGATVLFESPVRIGRTLAELVATVGPDRSAAVCRELTKIHEEVVRGTLAELADRFRGGARGEVTLVIAGGSRRAQKPDGFDLDQAIVGCLRQGMTARDIAQTLAQETALPRKLVYARVLELREG